MIGKLKKALSASPAIQNYMVYVNVYGLGWQVEDDGTVTLPGYSGTVDLHYAKPWRVAARPGFTWNMPGHRGDRAPIRVLVGCTRPGPSCIPQPPEAGKPEGFAAVSLLAYGVGHGAVVRTEGTACTAGSGGICGQRMGAGRSFRWC
ncbi:hypothetical protein GCM10023238_20000 [Streptomyces heliomycini]